MAGKNDAAHIPILKGFFNHNTKEIYVWCPYCEKYHAHGMGTGEKEHRVAHCINANSPFQKTGYYIAQYTRRELEKIGIKDLSKTLEK